MAKRKLQTDDSSEDWGNDEKLALLESLRTQCPGNDRLSFSARGNKVDWQKVAVGERTAEQCQVAWATMLARVRKFRTLTEVVSDAKDMVLHPEKYQKNKVKHPDQPSKPLTAYFQYVRDHRDKVKAKHPELSNVQLTKLLSERWQALDPSKQNKYVKRYKREWQAFQEANAKFLDEHPEMRKQMKPKPPSPFMLYVRAKQQAVRDKHPDLDNRTVQNKLKRKYSKLKPEKKKKWIQKALAAVPEYEEKVRNYQMQHPEFQPPTKKVRLTREEAVLNGDVADNPRTQKATTNSKKPEFPGAPGKPPRSAFQLFVKKKLAGMEGNLKEKMTTLGQQWQALGEKQKKYTKKLTAQQEVYKEQLEEFKQSLSAEEMAQFEVSLQPKKRVEKKTPSSPA